MDTFKPFGMTRWPVWASLMVVSGLVDALGGVIALKLGLDQFDQGNLLPGFVGVAVAVLLWGITGVLFLSSREIGGLETGVAYTTFAVCAGLSGLLASIWINRGPDSWPQFYTAAAFGVVAFSIALTRKFAKGKAPPPILAEIVLGYAPAIVFFTLAWFSESWLPALLGFVFCDVAASFGYDRAARYLVRSNQTLWKGLAFVPTGLMYMLLVFRSGNLAEPSLAAPVASVVLAVVVEEVLYKTGNITKSSTWIMLAFAVGSITLTAL